MFTRKPQTILTTKMANAKIRNKKTSVDFTREIDFTAPAEVKNGLLYVTIAGLTMPTNK